MIFILVRTHTQTHTQPHTLALIMRAPTNLCSRLAMQIRLSSSQGITMQAQHPDAPPLRVPTTTGLSTHVPSAWLQSPQVSETSAARGTPSLRLPSTTTQPPIPYPGSHDYDTIPAHTAHTPPSTTPRRDNGGNPTHPDPLPTSRSAVPSAVSVAAASVTMATEAVSRTVPPAPPSHELVSAIKAEMAASAELESKTREMERLEDMGECTWHGHMMVQPCSVSIFVLSSSFACSTNTNTYTTCQACIYHLITSRAYRSVQYS